MFPSPEFHAKLSIQNKNMRTKIIATLGPSSESKEMIHKLLKEGMDIARFNFSHCSYEEFKARKAKLREAGKELKKEALLLQDLQGPRIRVGEIPGGSMELREGETLVFSTKIKRDARFIFIDDPNLHLDLRVGEPIYLANGEMMLKTKKIAGDKIYAEVERGGTLISRKGVNVPNTKLTTSGLTAKDIKDVKFALKEGVDYIAISFVQTAGDVEKLRKLVKNKAKIIAKIETALALENIDEIIQASDAIMVARGDLGIEVAEEKLPFIQKNLLRQAAWHGKGSIVATQMLLSMINSPRPTRAEVSDIANAVLDGADAVMLSDETASGKHPGKALETLARVVRQAEKYHFEKPNAL